MKMISNEGKGMFRPYYVLTLLALILSFGIYAHAQSQYPLLDKIAQRVVQKYQQSSCQDIAQQKSQPPTGEEAQMMQNALEALHNNPQMREEFINIVAAPIANKLFECGMIP